MRLTTEIRIKNAVMRANVWGCIRSLLRGFLQHVDEDGQCDLGHVIKRCKITNGRPASAALTHADGDLADSRTMTLSDLDRFRFREIYGIIMSKSLDELFAGRPKSRSGVC